MDPHDSPLILPTSTSATNQRSHPPVASLAIPRTSIDLPWATVAKAILILVAATIAAHLAGLLTPILLQLLVALLLAAALTPPVHWLMARGLSRAAAVALVLGGLALIIGLLLLLLANQLVNEGRALATALPSYVNQAQGLLAQYPGLNSRIKSAAATGSGNPSSLLPFVLTAGGGAVAGVTDLIAVVVMAAYLLAGGERSLAYLLKWLSPTVQAKIHRATPDVVRVVSGYLLGQAVTSVLFGTYAFVVLVVIGAPQPLLLALLAALLDIVPIVGVLVATALPVALALTVSHTAALITLAAFVIYHQLESHILAPRIYGRTLGISSLAVLIAVLIGYRLLGIIGVLIALPLVAAVPAVVSAWRQEELLVGTDVHLPVE